MTNKTKFFVTGGSGFLGINLIRFLLKKDFEVVNYDIAEFEYPEIKKIRSIIGDIRDIKFLKKSMAGSDYVIHCAAALPLYSKEDIFSTDVDGTRNVMETALKLGIKRSVFISSTAVYGVPDHHPLYETDQLIGVGPYGEAKILAEKECRKVRKKGLCIPIIRPKSFIGPERLGVFALFYDWAKDGRGFPMIGSGNNRYQLLDVADLCEAIWLTLTKKEKIVNDIFNIGAKEFTTMKEDYQAVLNTAGYGKKIKPFPAWLAEWALGLLSFLKLSPVYKWVYGTAAKDSFVSIDKAVKILGYKPKYSNKDALIRNYKWYLKNLKSFEGKTGISHRVPWSQGILKIVKLFY